MSDTPLYFYLQHHEELSGLFRLRHFVDVFAVGQLLMPVSRTQWKWVDWCVEVIPGGFLRDLSGIERDEYEKRGYIEASPLHAAIAVRRARKKKAR